MPPSALPGVESWNAPLPDPIAALEQIMQQGGTTIVRAAFQYSFFAHPDAVRRQTPWYPERASGVSGVWLRCWLVCLS